MTGDQHSEGLRIRRFAPRDADAAAEIAKKSPESAQWPRATYQELEQHPRHTAWVVEVGGRVCGFLVALVVGGQAEILNLAVDPAHRRTGLGDALLNQACAEFQQSKADSVFLEVRESNLAAIHLYQKHGFVRAGERKQYYREPKEGAVLMIWKLQA